MDCPVCCESYQTSGQYTPRILSKCGHSLCTTCITRFLPQDTLRCPLCRQESTIKASGLDGFKVNFALIQLLEVKPPSLLKIREVKDDEYFPPSFERSSTEKLLKNRKHIVLGCFKDDPPPKPINPFQQESTSELYDGRSYDTTAASVRALDLVNQTRYLESLRASTKQAIQTEIRRNLLLLGRSEEIHSAEREYYIEQARLRAQKILAQKESPKTSYISGPQIVVHHAQHSDDDVSNSSSSDKEDESSLSSEDETHELSEDDLFSYLDSDGAEKTSPSNRNFYYGDFLLSGFNPFLKK